MDLKLLLNYRKKNLRSFYLETSKLFIYLYTYSNEGILYTLLTILNIYIPTLPPGKYLFELLKKNFASNAIL